MVFNKYMSYYYFAIGSDADLLIERRRLMREKRYGCAENRKSLIIVLFFRSTLYKRSRLASAAI